MHLRNSTRFAEERAKFYSALKKVFYDVTGENLPIYGVVRVPLVSLCQPHAKLKDYATSKKDMKKGVEIVPEENYRLRNEDLY